MKKLAIIILFIIIKLFFVNKAFNIDDYNYFNKTTKILIDNPKIAVNLKEERITQNKYYLNKKVDVHSASKPYLYTLYLNYIYKLTKIESEYLYHFINIIYDLIIIISLIYLIDKIIIIKNKQVILLTILSSSYIVTSNTIMTDTPMLAMFIASLVLFIAGVKKNNAIIIIISGFISIISYLISYQSLFLIILFILFIIINKIQRKVISWLPIILIMCSVIVWSGINIIYIDYPHILYAFKTPENLDSIKIGSFLEKSISNLTAIGGATIFAPILLIGLLKTRTDIKKYIGVLVISIVIAIASAGKYSILNKILFVIFLSGGIFTTTKIIEIPIYNKNKDDIFLSAWYIIYLITIIFLLPFGCVRYTLPMLPPLIILFVKQARKKFKEEKNFKIFAYSGIVCTIITGIAVAYADYEYANVYRDFARKFNDKYEIKRNDVWFTGEWGFRYYMEENDYKYIISIDNSQKEGDLVVIPDLPCPSPLHPKLKSRLKLKDTVVYNSKFPIRVMNREAYAGFYASGYGMLPYSFSYAPLETFKIYEVEIMNEFLKKLNDDKIENENNITTERVVINNIGKQSINAHPDSKITYEKNIGDNIMLSLSIALKDDVWSSDKGDGVEFEILITDDEGKEENVFSKYIDPKNNLEDRKWHDEEVDLSKYAGKTVEITFSTKGGPKGDLSWDWAVWGDPRIVSKEGKELSE